MKKILKDKTGAISIYAILWLSVLFPFLLFICIDVSNYVYQSVHLKGITDNASASAVTQIKEDLVSSGVLEIDEDEAQKVALNIIKHDLQLEDDLTPKENSPLKEKPTIEVQVVNMTSDEGVDVETPAGDVTIYKPSVVVYAEYPVRGLFYYKSGVMMKKVGVSQVQFTSNVE